MKVGVDVVPNLPNYSVPVLMLYLTYGSVWYRMKVCTGTGGTGIHIIPNLTEVSGTGITGGI